MASLLDANPLRGVRKSETGFKIHATIVLDRHLRRSCHQLSLFAFLCSLGHPFVHRLLRGHRTAYSPASLSAHCTLVFTRPVRTFGV